MSGIFDLMSEISVAYMRMKKSFLCILIFIRVGHFFHNLLNIYNILNFIDRVRHFLCK